MNSTNDQRRHQAHGQWVMSAFVYFLGALRVLAVNLREQARTVTYAKSVRFFTAKTPRTRSEDAMNSTNDQRRHQAHGQWVMSAFVYFLGALRVLAVNLWEQARLSRAQEIELVRFLTAKTPRTRSEDAMNSTNDQRRHQVHGQWVMSAVRLLSWHSSRLSGESQGASTNCHVRKVGSLFHREDAKDAK